MNTCKTCRYWNRVKVAAWGKNWEWGGDCSNKKFVYDNPLPKDGLVYMDYEDYTASFQTGEDFCCRHWKAQP